MKWAPQMISQADVLDAHMRVVQRVQDAQKAFRSLRSMFVKQEGMDKLDDAEFGTMRREFDQHRARLEELGAWLAKLEAPIKQRKWK